MSEVISLFPIAISVHDIEPNFTEQDKLFINKCLNDQYENTGNTTSNETYVLDKLPNLKQKLMEKVNFHFYETLKHVKESEIYITQSWINLTKKNQFHHTHKHPNSILAGVFYLQTVDDDSISFDNTLRVDQIRPSIDSFNPWNSSLYNLPVHRNMLVIFPSSLMHNVPTVKSDQVRISLAFNTFVKGVLGRDDQLSRVNL
jgi:uncharacterized protein (TIGR02466 family)